MTTTQATGRDQQIKRLCWLLDTMIEQLESAAPEGALSGIERDEDEAAKLIETTGLADEAEIPTERRPVLKRNMLSWEEFGFGHTEKHPTRVSYCFTETNGTWHYRLFDYLPTCGITTGPELDPPRGLKRAELPAGHWAAGLVSTKWPPPLEPDSQFIQTLVVCLKGWRARAKWNPNESAGGDDSRWSHQMTKTELACRLLNNEHARPRDAEVLFKKYRLRHVKGYKHQICLEKMDPGMRYRVENGAGSRMA